MRLHDAHRAYLDWLLTTRDLSTHTLRAYHGDLAAFERHCRADTPVALIDRDRITTFLDQQRALGLCAASLRRRASTLRGFCRWLSSQRLIPTDPSAEVAIPPDRSRRLPRTVSDHELDRLLLFLRRAAGIESSFDAQAPLPRPHSATTLLAVSLMIMTGVRVHEVVGVRCDAIDLPGRSFRLIGKGRKERRVFLTNKWISDLMHSYLRTRLELGLTHPYLLFNLHHDPLSTSAVRLRLAKATRAAGLSTHITPHMLRHTAATQLIEAGVDIRYIQRLLGHASLATTEIYTHVSDHSLKRVVSNADVLGRLISADN
jgi:integrase/recombinase XerD